MSAEQVLATIAKIVGTVWVFLIFFIWQTMERKINNRKLATGFMLLTVLAVFTLLISLIGLHLEITKDSPLYWLAFGASILFILLVGFYYFVLCSTMLQDKDASS